MAVTGAIMLGGAAVGYGASKMFSGGSKQPQRPAALPQAPDPAAAQSKANETIKRKRANMTKSIHTSPLGIAGEAQVARKTLLGQ